MVHTSAEEKQLFSPFSAFGEARLLSLSLPSRLPFERFRYLILFPNLYRSLLAGWVHLLLHDSMPALRVSS